MSMWGLLSLKGITGMKECPFLKTSENSPVKLSLNFIHKLYGMDTLSIIFQYFFQISWSSQTYNQEYAKIYYMYPVFTFVKDIYLIYLIVQENLSIIFFSLDSIHHGDMRYSKLNYSDILLFVLALLQLSVIIIYT